MESGSQDLPGFIVMAILGMWSLKPASLPASHVYEQGEQFHRYGLGHGYEKLFSLIPGHDIVDPVVNRGIKGNFFVYHTETPPGLLEPPYYRFLT